MSGDMASRAAPPNLAGRAFAPQRTALQTRSTAGVVAAWRPRRLAEASAGRARRTMETALYMLA